MNSRAAGMEAAVAQKMMGEFRAAFTAQVAGIERGLAVDAAELAKVTPHFDAKLLCRGGRRLLSWLNVNSHVCVPIMLCCVSCPWRRNIHAEGQEEERQASG